MKKLLALIVAAALLCTIAAAEWDDSALIEAVVPRNTSLDMDLNGDGVMESILWDMVDQDEYTSLLTLTVSAEGKAMEYETEFFSAEAVYASDMDGDGVIELLLTGDVASSDYYTICLHYEDGKLVELPFADGSRGENTGEFQSAGYGMPVAMAGNTITLDGSQDVLGTWFGTRVYALKDGKFDFADDGVWIRDMGDIDLDDERFWAEAYAPLTTKVALAYTAADGSQAELPVGAQLLVTASDKQTFAKFVTKDGVEGTLPIAANTEKGWGMLVNGIDEEDCFEIVPYAD